MGSKTPTGWPLQFVWWGWKWHFDFHRYDQTMAMRLVYKWIVSLGPLEFRRWAPMLPPEAFDEKQGGEVKP